MATGTAELGVDRNVIYLDYAGCGGKAHKTLWFKSMHLIT